MNNRTPYRLAPSGDALPGPVCHRCTHADHGYRPCARCGSRCIVDERDLFPHVHGAIMATAALMLPVAATLYVAGVVSGGAYATAAAAVFVAVQIAIALVNRAQRREEARLEDAIDSADAARSAARLDIASRRGP